jgi:acetyl esterase/lipase
MFLSSRERFSLQGRQSTAMELIARIIAYLALLSGILVWIKTAPGLAGAILWLPKLWASSWSPFLAMLGAAGGLLSWLSADPWTTSIGLLGALLAIRHTFMVTRPHAAFEQAFGSIWQDRIPPDLRNRLEKKRYTLVQPASPMVPGHRDVDLGMSGVTDEPLLCDIWEPPAGTPRTGLSIIYLHGGLWQALDKDFLTQPLFRRLAGQGHVIMDLAYSLAPGADLNRMLGDVKQAILWLRAHAPDYAVDPDRIVLMGVSGGAHLALMAAYAPGHPAFQLVSPSAGMSVHAVISMFGVTDLTAFFEEYGRSNPKQPEYSSQVTDDLRPRLFDKTWLDKLMTRTRAFPAYRHANMPGGPLLLVYLMGGTLKELPELYRQASPIEHVGPHCPPTLQIFDENEFVIDASHGRRLHQALCSAGVKSVYIEIPETVHGFDQYFGVSRRVAPAAQAATYDLERFLALMV